MPGGTHCASCPELYAYVERVFDILNVAQSGLGKYRSQHAEEFQ